MLTREQIKNLNPRKLKEFRQKGLTYIKIARLCGVNTSTIFRRLKEIRERDQNVKQRNTN